MPTLDRPLDAWQFQVTGRRCERNCRQNLLEFKQRKVLANRQHSLLVLMQRNMLALVQHYTPVFPLDRG